jgi:hypothetical protein
VDRASKANRAPAMSTMYTALGLSRKSGIMPPIHYTTTQFVYSNHSTRFIK